MPILSTAAFSLNLDFQYMKATTFIIESYNAVAFSYGLRFSKLSVAVLIIESYTAVML